MGTGVYGVQGQKVKKKTIEAGDRNDSLVVFGVLASGGRGLDDFGVVREDIEELFGSGVGVSGDGAVGEVESAFVGVDEIDIAVKDIVRGMGKGVKVGADTKKMGAKKARAPSGK